MGNTSLQINYVHESPPFPLNIVRLIHVRCIYACGTRREERSHRLRDGNGSDINNHAETWATDRSMGYPHDSGWNTDEYGAERAGGRK